MGILALTLFLRLRLLAFLLAGICALVACGGTTDQVGTGAGCGLADCALSLTLGPGDGSYVPDALDATAQVFLGPGSGTNTTASGSSSGSGLGGGTGFPRLVLDRTTLAPGKNTTYAVTRNQSLGLRGEISRPLSDRVRAYGAVSVGVGRHEYHLPQGLGPLADPIRIAFRTGAVTPEIGLRYEQAVPGLPGMQLHLSGGAGMVVSQTRTHLTSALLDVTSTSTTSQPFVSLGAGLVLPPHSRGQVEITTGARIGKGGAGVLRSEVRLSRLK